MNNFRFSSPFKLSIDTLLLIVCMFIFTRLVLFGTAYYSFIHFEVLEGKQLYWHYSENRFWDLFGYWDTGWYLYVANSGYEYVPLGQGQSNYGFFPLYPMLMNLFSYLIGGNTYFGGILASNVLLLVAAAYLYQLALHYYDKRSAMFAVVALFVFPGSYLFSGVFSESAFLCFSIACLYHFEKGEYLPSGIAGFLLALTRPFGVLILLPLALSFIIKKNIRIKWSYLWLGLIPLGTFLFFMYCYKTTGDFWFYVHCKEQGWDIQSSNPLKVIVQRLREETDVYLKFNLRYAIGIIVLSTLLIKRIKLPGYVWTMQLILAPLQNGYVNIVCMPRYITVCFPILLGIGNFAAKIQSRMAINCPTHVY